MSDAPEAPPEAPPSDDALETLLKSSYESTLKVVAVGQASPSARLVTAGIIVLGAMLADGLAELSEKIAELKEVVGYIDDSLGKLDARREH